MLRAIADKPDQSLHKMPCNLFTQCKRLARGGGADAMQQWVQHCLKACQLQQIMVSAVQAAGAELVVALTHMRMLLHLNRMLTGLVQKLHNTPCFFIMWCRQLALSLWWR